MDVVQAYVLGVHMHVLGVRMFIMSGECNRSVAVCMLSLYRHGYFTPRDVNF